MGLIERIAAEHQPRVDDELARAYALGEDLSPFASRYGHDDEMFSPPEYGNYLVTSNAVYACARLRADQLSSIPLRFYTGTSKDRTEVTTGEATELFHRVNPFWTFNRLMNMTELSLGIWGEAFWVLERDRGRPREIWWAKPSKMKVVPHATDYIAGFLYQPASGGEPIAFSRDEVLWLRYPNPLDEYAALSPIAAARMAADIEASSLRANRHLFDQGMQLGGFILPPQGTKAMSDEQVKDLQKMVTRRLSGVDKFHKWGVFKHDFQIKEAGVNPRDAEFLGGLRWSLLSVARAYGIPPELLGDDKRTYENFSQAMRFLWGFTLQPELGFIASEINEQLVPMLRGVGFCEFDTSRVTALRADDGGLWERVTRAFSAGAIGEKLFHELLGLEYDPDDRRKVANNVQLVPLGDDVPQPDRNGHRADGIGQLERVTLTQGGS